MTQAPPTISQLPPLNDPVDETHLKVLSILYYVWAGLTALGGCVGIFYLILGVLFISSPKFADANNPPPEFIGLFMACLGGCIMVYLWGLAACAVVVGVSISQCRRRIFCLVIAGIACLSIPLGTALGVYTFIALARPGIVRRFEENRRAREVDEQFGYDSSGQ